MKRLVDGDLPWSTSIGLSLVVPAVCRKGVSRRVRTKKGEKETYRGRCGFAVGLLQCWASLEWVPRAAVIAFGGGVVEKVSDIVI